MTVSKRFHDPRSKSNGYANTFNSPVEIQPYGYELIATNKECGGHMQNNNKGFKAPLWRFARKRLFCSSKMTDLAYFIAVCIFNEGMTPLLRMMEVAGITIEPRAKIMLDNRDIVYA